MLYSKDDINRLKEDEKGNSQEQLINTQVVSFINVILLHLNNNQHNRFTLTLHSCHVEMYECREEILKRLQLAFPSMNISAKYIVQDQEYFDITFDWNC
jgi:hypothetical protein